MNLFAVISVMAMVHSHYYHHRIDDKFRKNTHVHSNARGKFGGYGGSFATSGPRGSGAKAKGSRYTKTRSNQHKRRRSWRRKRGSKWDRYGYEKFNDNWAQDNSINANGDSSSYGGGWSSSKTNRRHNRAIGVGRRGSRSRTNRVAKNKRWRKRSGYRNRHGVKVAYRDNFQDNDYIRTGGKGDSHGYGYSDTLSTNRGSR